MYGITIFVSIAPSSPPSEVVYGQVTSTGFVLSWNAPPPESRNGVVRHYIISCIEHETGAVFQRLTANSTAERLIDSLHSFYSYTCSVAAVTVEEGPFSFNVTITTAQDGEVLAITDQSLNLFALIIM